MYILLYNYATKFKVLLLLFDKMSLLLLEKKYSIQLKKNICILFIKSHEMFNFIIDNNYLLSIVIQKLFPAVQKIRLQ